MMLSPHFSLTELCKSQLAVRGGIDNTPTPDVIKRLQQLCLNILEPVRAHFGKPFSPSSGYRCISLNHLLGSHDDSQHVKGEAADFEVPGVDNLTLAHWCRDNLDFDQLILEFYKPGDPASGWVHCSWKPVGRRRQALTISDRRVTVAGLPKI